MPRALVTYGTRYGATKGIASRIGERLRQSGFDTDVLHANENIEVRKYDAVIVGSPIYGRAWLPEPALLIIMNADALSEIPFALFSSGMIDVKHHRGVLRQEHDAFIRKLRSETETEIEPLSTAVFDGAMNRSNLPKCMQIVDMILGVTPQGDFRDWEAIDKWADNIAFKFKSLLEAE